jgi:hypothetical protein
MDAWKASLTELKSGDLVIGASGDQKSKTEAKTYRGSTRMTLS